MYRLRKILVFTRRIIIFSFLTVLSQIGGLIYLLTRLTYRWTDPLVKNKFAKAGLRMSSFLVLYCTATFLIVPPLARLFGRVPLPIAETGHLRPRTKFTGFFNRNYVTPELKKIVMDVAAKMNTKYPGTVLNYMDANFPFIDRCVLLPHLGHNDGQKLDISFCYRDAASGNPTNECPSWLGYGSCEKPLPNEYAGDLQECINKNWKYSFMANNMPEGDKKNFTFDPVKTRDLVNYFAGNAKINKVFFEPYLKRRLKLTNPKIKNAGCHAVRHDDHLHVQTN